MKKQFKTYFSIINNHRNERSDRWITHGPIMRDRHKVFDKVHYNKKLLNINQRHNISNRIRQQFVIQYSSIDVIIIKNYRIILSSQLQYYIAMQSVLNFILNITLFGTYRYMIIMIVLNLTFIFIRMMWYVQIVHIIHLVDYSCTPQT